jgi:hypothetical protein
VRPLPHVANQVLRLQPPPQRACAAEFRCHVPDHTTPYDAHAPSEDVLFGHVRRVTRSLDVAAASVAPLAN